MSDTVTDAELVERFPWQLISHDSKFHFRGWLDKQLLIKRLGNPKPLFGSGKRHYVKERRVGLGPVSDNTSGTEQDAMATMFLYIHLTDLTEVAARP